MEIKQDRIYVGGCSVKDLAEQFGTPVYVYDADAIVNNFRSALTIAKSCFDQFEFFYAIKACNNLSIAELLVQEGAGIDAASLNEIRLAKALGLEGSRIMFSGNYLSNEDLAGAINLGAIINLDDESMLPRLLRFGKPEIICFRVNPGVGDSMLGDKLTNAGPKAKFGIHEDHVIDAYKNARDAGISRFGVHMMPGSCMLLPKYFHEVTKRLMQIVFTAITELRIQFEFIDLGGGLGIPYEPGQRPLDLRKTMEGMAAHVAKYSKKKKIPIPKIIMEPARYFVGNAGFVIGRVHTIKHGYTKIVGTDISMNTLARPAMYGVFHRICIDGKESDPRETMGLCGQVCENTDFWCRDRELPETIAEDDIVVVCDAGAYGYAMSYEYNGRLRPAEVLVQSGKPRLIRRREVFGDMVRMMAVSKDVASRLEQMAIRG